MIKIVGLYDPEKVKAAPPEAKLVYGNGLLLAAVDVVTVFWGSFWKDQSELASSIDKFFDYIVTSPLIDSLGEYSVDAYKIGSGKHSGSLLVDATISANLDDAGVTKMLQDKIGDGTLPKPGANTLYFIYLPSGVKIAKDAGASCSTFCGYHDHIDSNIFYAVMPYPDCVGCLGGLSVFDALTSTSSHELCEAVTDPIPGQGWYDNTYGEIGDICAWKTKKLGDYTIQLEWSNKNNGCM